MKRMWWWEPSHQGWVEVRFGNLVNDPDFESIFAFHRELCQEPFMTQREDGQCEMVRGCTVVTK